jgi:hypothetical protein
MALKGLIIRQPWIGMILAGTKTWEMRSTGWKHRGPIALIEKGTGRVVGTARMVEDRAPLTEAEMRATMRHHGIPADQIAGVVADGWVRPWVLADVKKLVRPVPYVHPPGAVKTVNLDDGVSRAVQLQLAA